MPLLAERAILSLKKRKAPGLDGIVAELIQHASSVCGLFLHQLFLEIWKTGRLPKAWKRQEIVVLHKAGSGKECSNYRTIVLMSHASKILLTIILNRMKEKIEAELPDEQAGFRAGRSTVDMLYVLQIIIEKSLEWQNPISILFIDYRKAFDTVNHLHLFDCLLDFGFLRHYSLFAPESLHGDERSYQMEWLAFARVRHQEGCWAGLYFVPTSI